MKLNALLGFFCLLLGACSGNGFAAVKPDVDVEIVNQSARDLQNAGARFGEHACEWGFVGKTFTKFICSIRIRLLRMRSCSGMGPMVAAWRSWI